MRRQLDTVDADMLPVLWLPDPASAEKGTRTRPGSGVLHTNVGDLVSHVERLQQHKFQTCTKAQTASLQWQLCEGDRGA